MKKLSLKSVFAVIAILAAALLLPSCGSAKDDETLYYTHPMSSYVYYKNGMFRTADGIGMVEFLDFDSMVSVPICPKPNCSHTDPNTCSALGISNSRFIYDNKLWWFDRDFIYDENGEISDRSTLYSADVDGTKRMKAAVLDGLGVLSEVYIKNGRAYFGARDFGWDNIGTTNYDKAYLYCYDFESKEFTELCSVKEGYNATVSIIGRYENSLALMLYDGVENKSDFNPARYMLYDLDNGEFTELDKKINCAQKDWLITIEDDGTIVVNHAYSDEEYRITDERFTQADWGGYCVFDGMLFESDGFAYELETGKVHTTQFCNIWAYYNGKYIVRFAGTVDLDVLTKKELFLD